MTKFTKTAITDTSHATAMNTNMTNIETFSDTCLTRDGLSPNQMNADLDMNSNRVLNSPAATADTHLMRKGEVDAAILAAAIDTLVINGLSDVDTTGVAANDLLYFDGVNWVDTGGSFTWDGGHLVLPLNNDAVTPTLAFGDGDTGFYETVDDEIRFVSGGLDRFRLSGLVFSGSATNAAGLQNITPTSTAPGIHANRTDLDTGIGWAGADQLSLIAGGVEVVRVLGNTPQIFGDITTATPPVAEAITARLAFYDSDGSDILSSIGHIGGPILYLENRMHGGAVVVRGEDNAGATRPMLSGDPDANTSIYHAGIRTLLTEATGIAIQGTVAAATPPTTEAVDTRMRLFDSDLTDELAQLGFGGSNLLILRNRMHGGNISFITEDAAGVGQTLLAIDPDAKHIGAA